MERSVADMSLETVTGKDAAWIAALYRGAVESAETGILALDERGGVVLYNDAMAGMTGYGRDELTTEDWAQTLYDTPEARELAIDAYQRTMAGETVVTELPVRRKDGTRCWLYQYATEIDVEGQRCFVVYSTDVTQRKRTEDERERVLRELDAIARISDVALSTLRLDDLLVVLLRELVGMMGAEKALFLLTEQDQFVLGATHDITSLPPDFSMPLDQGISGQVAAEGSPRYFADAQIESTRLPGFFETEGIHTAISAPLRRAGMLIGVLHVFWTSLHEYDPAELRLLDIVGDRATLAIVNSKLFEQTRRGRESAEALERISAAANSTLDFDEMMNRVIAEATSAMGCDTMTVDLLRDDEWVVAYGNGETAAAIGVHFQRHEVPLLEEAARTRRPVAVADVHDDPRVDPARYDPYHVRSMLIVPMTVRGAVEGMLRFHYVWRPRPFSTAQIGFGRRVAAVVALAVANSRLYATQERIAGTIQQALLAVPKHVTSLRFGHVYRSGTEATEVGGDFYDLFPLLDGRVGVLLGDVSGKGLKAATLAALVKNAAKAYAYESRCPGDILAAVNRLVWHSAPRESFVTMVLGLFDPASGELCFCSAGHPPPIVCRRAGPLLLDVSCPLLGAIENAEFQESSVTLDPGDALVLYSDGVTEARRDHDFFGEGRLLDSIRRSRVAATAETIPRLILDDVLAFTGGRLFDDLAILAVARTGASEG